MRIILFLLALSDCPQTVFGALCSEFCVSHLGESACSFGSYCKNNYDCHRLFWKTADKANICIYNGTPDCPTTHLVLCSEAENAGAATPVTTTMQANTLTTVAREVTIAPPTVIMSPSQSTVKVHDSSVTFNNAEPPLTFPTDTFLSFVKLIEQQPIRHKATLIYFDGMQGSGANQLERMHEKGLLNGLTDTLRVVAAEMRDTTRNGQRLWFPWGHHPYQIVPNLNLGARSDMEDSMRVIMPIIEREARLLGGEYSRIYLLGYSQGGMMATWLGLMSNRPLGGVINMHGVFPVFDLDQVSEAGKDVTIYHLHDPLDTKVIYANAEKGLRSAVAAGARGYTTIVDTVVNGEAHHGFSQNVCKVVNAWLHDVFNRSRLK